METPTSLKKKTSFELFEKNTSELPEQNNKITELPAKNNKTKTFFSKTPLSSPSLLRFFRFKFNSTKSKTNLFNSQFSVLSASNILDLPGDIINSIMSFLPVSDLVKFAKCSRTSLKFYKKFLHSFTTYVFNWKIPHKTNTLTETQKAIFWIGIYYFWEEFITNEPKLQQLCFVELPSSLRKIIWQKRAESWFHKKKNPGIFLHCSSKVSSEDYQIKKDIGRTFPNHEKFLTPQSPGCKKLLLVLNSFANFNEQKDTQYCQGMNFIAGTLLLVFDDEEDVFWVLIQMMKSYYFSEIYATGLPGLLKLTQIFDNILETQIPEIGELFKKMNLKTNMFAYKWFLCLFSSVLPIQLVLRVWDLFYLKGWEISLRIGLAILKRSESHLQNMSVDDICVYFDHLPPEVLEPVGLIETALSFKINPEEFKEFYFTHFL